jgi:hypothetical protein
MQTKQIGRIDNVMLEGPVTYIWLTAGTELPDLRIAFRALPSEQQLLIQHNKPVLVTTSGIPVIASPDGPTHPHLQFEGVKIEALSEEEAKRYGI